MLTLSLGLEAVLSPLTLSTVAFEEPDSGLQSCSIHKHGTVKVARVGDESGRQPGHAGGAAFPRALVSSQLEEDLQSASPGLSG